MNPIKIRTRKFDMPHRGANSSADLKGFVDEIFADLHYLASELTRLKQDLHYANTHLILNEEFTRDALLDNANRAKLQALFTNRAGNPSLDEYDHFITLYDSTVVSFENTNERHGYYEQSIGKVYPPRNAVTNFFYQRDALKNYKAISRQPAVTFNIEPTIDTTVFMTENSTENMFNGDNHLYWVREYSYPLHSDVSEVALEFTIDVPAGLGVDPNLIMLDPFPSFGLSVDSLITNTGVIISEPVVNSSRLVYEVPAGTTSVTAAISQRGFKIQNGRKVFSLGFREIDLQYVVFDDTAVSLSPDTSTDNHVVLTLDLNGEYTKLNKILFDCDVNKVIIEGYLDGAADANTYTVIRTAINDDQLITATHSFAGSVNKLKFYVFLTADATENGDRNGVTIDYINNISVRMEA